MNKKLYFTLAKNNIKKNKNTFFPFALSATTMIALFYMLAAITVQTNQAEAFTGARSMQMVLDLGVWVCGIFSVGVIFYTNSFLMKQRSRELGLYSILGMEKRHIGKVLFWEVALIGGGSILGGLFFGIVFSKLMFMLLVNLMKINTKVPFGISPATIGRTVLIFAAVFVVNIILSTIKLKFVKPIDLLRSENQGEKEPKAKWITALIGLVCLGIGYYLAVTTLNPIKAMNTFFIAVLFVMVGTYFVFMSGSIALLKLLKKNKKFYFHERHFITVSGMMFRMKRNAVGLANICILSTAVLVVLSSTVSLYIGIDDIMRVAYPQDVQTTYLCPAEEGEEQPDPEMIRKFITDRAKENNVTMSNIYEGHELSSVVTYTGNKQYMLGFENMDTMDMLSAVSQEEYNAKADKDLQLEELSDQEVWVYDTLGEIQEGDTFSVAGVSYKARLIPEEIRTESVMESGTSQTFASEGDGYNYLVLVLPDLDAMKDLVNELNHAESVAEYNGQSTINYEYCFDLNGKKEDITNFCNGLREGLDNAGIPHIAQVGNIFTDRADYMGIYASVFFIGIFIGAMFLLTTVLIIYYKQVSEGYEDRARFDILKKVGMSQGEIKKVITTQVLQVFFLPILLASVHIAFAFPIIKRLLEMMYLNNTQLYIICTIGSILVFLAVYAVVYILTARTYYKIVYGGREQIRGRK